MARRGYDRMRRCAVGGCREVSITNYEYKRDYTEAVQREAGKPWHCTRHTKPDEVLSASNTERTATVVAGTCDGKYSFLTWEGDGSGFIYGPGFRAWAQDFPAGTKLTITAKITLPDVT